MLSCLILRGRSNSGKTYASRKLEKKFNCTCVHYDAIIESICECTRLFFENRLKEKPVIRVSKTFWSDSDFTNFKSEIFNLISSNRKFFFELYKKFIKNTISRGLVSKKELKLLADRSKLVKVVPASIYLQNMSNEIFNLMFKHLIKNSDFVILEGIYFLNDKYLKDVENVFDEIRIVECSYIPAIGSESYFYENEKFSSIDKLEEKIIVDFGKFRKNTCKT